MKKKGTAKWVVGIIVILLFVGLIEQDDNDVYDEENEEEQEEEWEEEWENDESDEKDVLHESNSEISDGIERITSGEYLFVTNEDLDKYSANMDGAKVYVVTEIDDIKDDMIQSTLSDGYMMSCFNVGENYSKYESELNDGDVVGISGTVEENTSYGFMGSSVSLKDCLVFAVGENAELYRKDSSDDGLSQYFSVTDEVADSGKDVTEEEYKALCTALDYEDILRNPDSNDRKYCVVEGTAEQIIEGWLDSFTIYVTDYNGNKWGCVYSYKDGESHLLEGDSVAVYGKCEGTDTAETLMGKQVTIPRVDVEYIN